MRGATFTRSAAAMAGLAMLLLLASTAGAVNLWQGDPETVGDWFSAADWSLGAVPTLADAQDVQITADGQVRIADANAQAYRLLLGVGAGQSGTLNLASGSLASTNNALLACYVGYDGTGTFQHTGGTHSIQGALMVGHGSGSTGRYELGGAASQVSASFGFVGWEGAGTFQHAGGAYAGDSLYVGYYAGSSGSFAQTAGTTSLADHLYVGLWSDDARYTLGGTGQISATALLVGYYGGSNGQFEQSGGAVTLADRLSLGWEASVAQGDARGSYRITAGTLRTPSLLVGTEGWGTLDMAGAAARVSVADTLHFGPHATLTAVQNAAIRLTGATAAVENLSTDPAAMAGLSNLVLVCENGIGAAASLEVGGTDQGAVEEGFAGNFALDLLRVGDNLAGSLRLADAVDNRTDSPEPEALYVDHVVLAEGSQLDLNGLNVYAHRLTDLGGTILENGGSLTLLSPPISADFNGDGDVDGADFLAWHNGYRTDSGAAHSQGDADADGDVDARDFWAWRNEFQAGLGAASESAPATFGAIPEPTTLALLALAALAVRRKR